MVTNTHTQIHAQIPVQVVWLQFQLTRKNISIDIGAENRTWGHKKKIRGIEPLSNGLDSRSLTHGSMMLLNDYSLKSHSSSYFFADRQLSHTSKSASFKVKYIKTSISLAFERGSWNSFIPLRRRWAQNWENEPLKTTSASPTPPWYTLVVIANLKPSSRIHPSSFLVVVFLFLLAPT